MMEPTPNGTAVPVHAAPAALMRELLEALWAAGYSAEGVCERLGIESIFQYQSADFDRAGTIESPLDALIRLFLAGRAMPAGKAMLILGERMIGGLRTIGVLRADDVHAGLAVPTVLFYPVEGRFVCSDLGADPLPALEGGGSRDIGLPADSVYPGIARNTGDLLSLLPRDPCESFLDLCSGTATIGLVAARFAGHVWAVDLTDRATRFAEFNVALNGATNVTVLQGDLYGPVIDRTFDFIVAHPPYVPSRGSGLIYRAGGLDGEHVTRRVIEGLPRHLRPGGRFYCSCMLSDRRDGKVEQRLRTMLGDAGHEFDIFVIAGAASSPAEYYSRRAPDRGAPAADEGLVDELTELGVEHLVLCRVVIRRHSGSRVAVTARRQSSDRTGRAEVDWLIQWETAAQDPDLPARLVASRVRISPAVRLELVSRPGDRAWVPERCLLRVDWPFGRVAEVPLEIAQFVIGCDGTRTVGEHLDRAKSQGLAPADLTATAFAAGLMPLIGSGVLAVESGH